MNNLATHKLLNADTLKKHFHHILSNAFTSLRSSFYTSPSNEPHTSAELEDLVINFIQTLLSIFGIHVTEDNKEQAGKFLLSLIQNFQQHDANPVAVKNAAEASLYRIIFEINQSMFDEKNTCAEFLYLLRLNCAFVKCLLLSAPGSYSLISTLSKQNNYQLCLQHFVLFKLSGIVKTCHEKLKSAVQDLPSFNKMNEFYEVNVFNREVLTNVFALFKCFLGHLESNQMEVIYFDWPMSCLVWNILDYFNFYSGIHTNETQKFNEFNQILYRDLIGVVLTISEKSIRFRRMLNFLGVVLVNSESSAFTNASLR
jgi:hypothetical protein